MCSVLLPVSVKLHLRDERTNKQTDRQTPGIEFWCFLALNVTSGGSNLMIFLIFNSPNFLYLLVDHGFLPPPFPLNLYETSRFVQP